MSEIELNNFYVSHKRSFIFTDIDLDGAMSYLLFKWATDKKIPYITCRVTDFRKTFSNWLKHHKVTDYDTIYILDLDVSSECLAVVDKPNVVIIDHHESHYRNKHKYKHATTYIEHTTSCAKLIYKLLLSKLEDLTPEQKLLVLMVDDYDCYKLRVPNSHELNMIFWNYQGDKLIKFINSFSKGFTGFTPDQKSIVKFYKTKIKNVTQRLEMFEGNIPIGSVPRRVIATFADTCINDVADFLITQHSADISIVVNEQSGKVSFRKNKSCDVDLSIIAKTIADGGGHEYAAGGVMSEKFATFTKLLKPV